MNSASRVDVVLGPALRAEQAKPNPENGHHPTSDNCKTLDHGTSADYLTARIARDRPDILEEMKQGKYRIVLGEAYAAKIDEQYRDRPGNPTGANQHTQRNPYAHKDSSEDKQYGTSTAYLRQQIKERHPEVMEQIGKGKEYKTVTEAARKLGIRRDRDRLCVYADDPQAAQVERNISTIVENAIPEGQLRPIAQAKLQPQEQREVARHE